MSEVKWIKLGIGLPDNRKIKRIRRLPDGNNIVLLWVFLLIKAGESNKGGGLFFLEDMPYTIDDLADEFDFSVDLVKFALTTLEKLKMIEVYDDIIYIKNWEKYQSVDKLERMKEQTRQRVARHREKKKLEQPKEECNVTCNGDVTDGNATDIDKDKELDIDKDKEYIPYVEIINYLNSATNKNYRSSTNKTKKLIKARWNEGFRLDDFKKVIDNKTAEWLNNEKMQQYLRPDTLFGTKFEGYLNQKQAIKSNDQYDNLF